MAVGVEHEAAGVEDGGPVGGMEKNPDEEDDPMIVGKFPEAEQG